MASLIQSSFLRNLYNAAVESAVQGNHAQAIEQWSRIVALAPQTADAYYSRGVSYASLGDGRRAVQDFVAYLKLRSDNLYMNESMQHILNFTQGTQA